jgi:N-acetylglucosamine-6-sulfatase
MRRAIAAACVAVGLAVAAQPSSASHDENIRADRLGPSTRPNIVLVVLDDATAADVGAMPSVQSLIASQGTSFTANYSPEPLCCPARATILTGEYPHNHRVLDNVAPLGGFTRFDDSSTVATWLDAGGYETGLFGKYLNDNGAQDGYVPPGWDRFVMPVRGDTYDYVGPDLWINGQQWQFGDAQGTRLYSQHARGFLTRAVEAGRPFFAYVPLIANHNGRPWDDYPGGSRQRSTPWVAAKYRDTAPRDLPADLSVNEADVSDKPSWVRDRPLLTPDELTFIAERHAQRQEALRSADDAVAHIVGTLSAEGVLQQTYIIITSDNGYMEGQHRISHGKAVPYEPATRMPLIIRGPGFPAGETYDRVTGLQDIAPTIADVANRRPATRVDGVSLLRLVRGSVQTRRPQLIEIPVTARMPDTAVQAGQRPSPAEAAALRPVTWRVRGIVTSGGWKYLRYPESGEAELYDLNADPFELQNLADDPDYQHRANAMSHRLREWQSCRGAGCR